MLGGSGINDNRFSGLELVVARMCQIPTSVSFKSWLTFGDALIFNLLEKYKRTCCKPVP